MTRAKALCISILILLAVSPALHDAAFSEEPKPENGFTVGVFDIEPEEEYIVAEEKETGKKRLYKKSEFRPDGSGSVVPGETVMISRIEYRYVPIEGGAAPRSDDFELAGIEDGKAVLIKEHEEQPLPEPDAAPPFDGFPLPDEAPPPETLDEIQSGKPGKEPAKRLVASLFLKIGSKKISDAEWDVELPSALDAAANFGEVLGVVSKKISDLIDPEKKAVIYLRSSLGRVKLGPDGLLLDSLNSRLRRRFGIEDDDLVKTVNGKGITGIGDVASVFSTFSGSRQTVTVVLIRDEEEVTQTYHLK